LALIGVYKYRLSENIWLRRISEPAWDELTEEFRNIMTNSKFIFFI
jgi:hypothetical protein